MAKTIITSLMALAFIADTAMAQGSAPMSIAESAAKTAADRMSKLDADKDGKVTQKEWTDSGASAPTFAANDANKDGAITAEELAAVLRATTAAFDGNKDGMITNEEILAFMRANAGGRGPGGGQPPAAPGR